MAENNNSVWPGWETVKLIGRGSFGTVYEIQRKLFDDVEKAALKVISIPQNESDIEEMYNDGYDSESITSTFNSHLKNIVAEYSLMKKMSGCVNIVNCDDVRYVQHDDGIGWDIYIKMELLTPLVKVLPEKPSEDLVIKLAKDICNALVYCKKYDIVHRDIKPQNIFASENGEYKLGDFGIAKTVEKTMGGTKIGTYKYMAPEVYNNQPYGSAADIYSLGLVLYWLLNERRMPFMPLPPAKLKSGMEEEARNRRFSGEDLPAPRNGSKALKEIVLKACAYDIENRYSSAAEMLADLEKIECGAVAQQPKDLPEVVDESFLLTLNQQEEVEPEGTVSLFTRRSEPTQRPVVEDKKVEVPASVVEPVTETAKQKETPAVKETVIPVKQPEEKEKTPVKKNGGKKGLIIGAIILIAAIIIFLLLRGCGGTNPGVSGDKSTETVSEIVSDTSTEESFVPSVSDEDEHTHSYSSNWKYNETAHWYECSCGEKSNVAIHSYGSWKTITAATETKEGEQERTCTKCNYKETTVIPVLSHKHSYSTSWKSNATAHWYECACGERTEVSLHVLDHLVSREKYHYYECSVCGYEDTKVQHIYSDWVIDVYPSCTSTGEKYRYCTGCRVVLETASMAVVPHSFFEGTCSACKKLQSEGLDIRYELGWNGAAVFGLGTCTDSDIHIPAEYNGVVVTTIVEGAFENCDITSVTMHGVAGVYTGDYAFSHCDYLTTVLFSSSPHTIGVGAFTYCPVLTSVSIPSDLTHTLEIQAHAFASCKSLTTVSLPSNTESIGAYAFADCTNLKNISIPNSIVSIGVSAFDGSNILNYNTYDNANYLGNSDNPYLALVKAKDTYITSCSIHPSTKVIVGRAFNNCIRLANISIPTNVVSVNEEAFTNCDSLTSITIPANVVWIGASAFYECDALTSVRFADTSEWYVTIIDDAFSGDSIDVANPSTVARLLKHKYSQLNWYKE